MMPLFTCDLLAQGLISQIISVHTDDMITRATVSLLCVIYFTALPEPSPPDIHVLQWMHGCEADDQPDGTLKFHQGIDTYSYDGDNFLYFDDANGVWVAPVEAAKETKNRWDHVQMLTDYTKGYLKRECVKWLSDFLQFQHEKFQAARTYDLIVPVFISIVRSLL